MIKNEREQTTKQIETLSHIRIQWGTKFVKYLALNDFGHFAIKVLSYFLRATTHTGFP